jgi:hypothetical protein
MIPASCRPCGRLLTSCSYSKLTSVESLPPGPRALSRHAAHNSIFFLFPAFLGLNPVPRLERFWSFPTFPPRFWHVPCWATLSKIRFEGTKKPIGWFAEAGTAIDVPSLGRPSSWRPAKLIAPTPGRQPILITFLRFFSENSQVVDLQRSDSPGWMWRNGKRQGFRRTTIGIVVHVS